MGGVLTKHAVWSYWFWKIPLYVLFQCRYCMQLFQKYMSFEILLKLAKNQKGGRSSKEMFEMSKTSIGTYD